jgi:hypothetical protein
VHDRSIRRGFCLCNFERPMSQYCITAGDIHSRCRKTG